MNKTICLYICLFVLALSLLKCLTDSGKKVEDIPPVITNQDTTSNVKKNDEIHESFRKVGWITDSRYRVLVFIITRDECYNSPKSDIEAKLKLAAYTSLQHELNPSANRNASAQIKKMIDDFGEMIQVDKSCNSENIFFYDVVKNDLKLNFEKIKQTK